MDIWEELKKIKEEDEMLFEMAYNKKQILDRFLHNFENVISHLMLVYLFRDNKEKNHWEDEVHSFINRTYRCKSNNKFLSIKDIESVLLGWTDCFDQQVSTYIDEIKAKEEIDEVPEFSIEKLTAFLTNYFKWLSKELSTKGQVSREEVKNKIDELIKVDEQEEK